jgi:cytochrome P450 / NADPH-cytochrome P450 reductase
VMVRFGLPWDAMLNISSKSRTALPTDQPISAHDLFAAYVELSQPATKRNVAMLLEACSDGKTKAELQAILHDDFQAAITDKRVSLLDLLERYPSINLPLGAFVGSLISMRVRQYSISSSPLADPHKVSLTYAVLNTTSLSGQGRHIGVASYYLSKLQPGDITHIAVKPSHQAFHLPAQPESIPVLIFCAGTGIAPFRSFIQERAALIGAGRTLAPAHLYYGCRHPEKDSLYADELDRWEKLGAVTVHRTYSQAPELTGGHKHIDTLMKEDSELLSKLWDEGGARAYVCGSREVGESVKKACMEVVREFWRMDREEDTEKRAEKWFESVRNERFSSDVFV